MITSGLPTQLVSRSSIFTTERIATFLPLIIPYLDTPWRHQNVTHAPSDLELGLGGSTAWIRLTRAVPLAEIDAFYWRTWSASRYLLPA